MTFRRRFHNRISIEDHIYRKKRPRIKPYAIYSMGIFHTKRNGRYNKERKYIRRSLKKRYRQLLKRELKGVYNNG